MTMRKGRTQVTTVCKVDGAILQKKISLGRVRIILGDVGRKGRHLSVSRVRNAEE